jgi:hypothetical protein
MKREHFTEQGLHMNETGKEKISGILTSRIMEVFTTHPLGTSIALPWKAETTEEGRNR